MIVGGGSVQEVSRRHLRSDILYVGGWRRSGTGRVWNRRTGEEGSGPLVGKGEVNWLDWTTGGWLRWLLLADGRNESREPVYFFLCDDAM